MSFVLPSKIAQREDDFATRSSRHTGRCYLARLAVDEATRREAFRLRYDSYLDQGHIRPNRTRMFEDRYDGLPNSRIVVVHDEIGPVGSVRVCLLGRPGMVSPASEAFPAELSSLLETLPADSFAAEITRLVRSPAAADDQALVFLLYRLANYIGFVEQVALLLASVRRNHAVFYKRLGFEVASEPRPYPGLTCEMQLMQSGRKAYERSFARFPLMDPFAPGAEPLDDLLRGENVRISLLPGAERRLAS